MERAPPARVAVLPLKLQLSIVTSAFEMRAAFEWTPAGERGQTRIRIHTFAPYSLEAYADLLSPAAAVISGGTGR